MALMRWHPFRNISRWEPRTEFDILKKEMDSLFEQFLSRSSLSRLSKGLSELTYMPVAEIDETDTEIYLKLEIPGMSVEDLDIQVTDDTVSITGERQSEHKLEEGDRVRSEFHYGKFERIIPLPSPIDRDHVTAEYKDGILSLKLPKSEEHQEKAIKIKVT